MLLNIFLALYVAPFAVTVAGGIPFVVKDRKLLGPLLVLAVVPLFNVFLAATVLVVGTQMFLDWRKNPGDYHP